MIRAVCPVRTVRSATWTRRSDGMSSSAVASSSTSTDGAAMNARQNDRSYRPGRNPGPGREDRAERDIRPQAAAGPRCPVRLGHAGRVDRH